MDPLSITSGVIAIIQISTGIVSICSDYVRDVKDAPSDLRKIMVEIAAVKGIFEALSLLLAPTGDDHLAGSQENDNERSYSFLRDPIAGCARELTALDALFPKAEDRSCDGKRRKCILSLRSLAWPLKAHHAKKHLDDISRYKATISLALTTRSCLDISNMSGKVERIHDALSNKERQDILKWLVTTDPSSNHNNACNLHEPHTGNWLTRSLEYLDWKKGSIRSLWLHGIPGAGKTILASFIIEDVKAFCKVSAPESTGWAYYYCYFGHKQDETPHLLRWVINQLCRQMNAIPDEVRQLFHDGGSSPVRELKAALGALLRSYHRVYLVIDALDESLERERILNLLVSVLDDHVFQKLQLLMMSRKEVDIERALLGVSVDISLSNLHVGEDIRVYVQNTLRDNHKFSRWPVELRREIEIALVKGAKGMFRWAFCQLEILKRINTIPEIRKALGELPRTLDETYERILSSIVVENREIAYKTLQLLAFDFGVTRLGALLDALAVDIERCTFSRDNRILDPEALLEICTCLITITPEKDAEDDKNLSRVQLAHYTVKEYLLSDRIGHSSASSFQMSTELVYPFVAKCFIIYMLVENYHALPEQWSCNYDLVGLMGIAMSYWASIVRETDSNGARKTIIPLVLRLLDATGPHFQNWVKAGRELTDGLLSDNINEWTVIPGCESCLTLVYLCYFKLFEAAKQFVESLLEPVPFHTDIKFVMSYDNFVDSGTEREGIEKGDDIEDGTLLHMAALTGQISFVEYFISKGADVNSISAKGLSVLGSALGKGWVSTREPECVLQIVEILLKNGADPNLSGVSCTPLQRVAANNFDNAIDIATILLEFGADINGVGNDESNVTRLLLSIDDFRLQNDRVENLNFSLKDIITERDEMWNYDSPLRIVENMMKSIMDKPRKSKYDYDFLEKLGNKREFLISRGAKSLHYNPIGNLPGHIEAHIEEYFEGIGYEASSTMLNDAKVGVENGGEPTSEASENLDNQLSDGRRKNDNTNIQQFTKLGQHRTIS